MDEDYDSDGRCGGLCMRKGNWSTLIEAPYAETECTCLPDFGVQLCRIWGNMPSFLNCCHVLRIREANKPRVAIYLQYTTRNKLLNIRVTIQIPRHPRTLPRSGLVFC